MHDSQPLHEFHLVQIPAFNRFLLDFLTQAIRVRHSQVTGALEVVLVADLAWGDRMAGGQTDHMDFWGVARDGRASLIRSFNEDRFEVTLRDLAEGAKWFDPWCHVRDLTEIARHARAMPEAFDTGERVWFLIEWKGAEGAGDSHD